MSDYAFVAERAKKAFASVARLESALARDPNDHAISVNLASMRRFAEQARLEMERLAAVNQIEICEYRMVPIADGDYGLSHVSKSLLEYQNLFSQIYDAIKNGPKRNATIGKDAEHESMLNFAFSYSGSLGVVLLARSERTFFDGKLDKPIEAVYQILDIDNVDTVKDIANTLGRAVVKRVHDWSKVTVEGGFSADIRWKRSDGRILGQHVDQYRLNNIVAFIGSTSDVQTERVSVRGMLVGGDISSNTFHLTVPGGETYSGGNAVDAELATMTLGQIYEATIEISSVYYYATDQTKKTNTLVRLSGPIRA